MPLTASKLREDVYRILDRVLETGIPVEIERKGRLVRIVLAEGSTPSKLANLEPHAGVLRGDPEDIVHLDWSDTWSS